MFSSIVLFNIPSVYAEVTFPDPPTNLDVIIRTGTEGYIHDLSWEAPSDDGGAAISGYKIEYANLIFYSGIDDMQSSYWNVLETTKDTQTGYTYESTSFDETLCFRVSAYNSVGTGLPSNYGGTCWNNQADVPDRIFNLEATEISDSQIDLSWDAPDDNGLPILGYKIEYHIDLETFVLIENSNNQETNYSHTDLLPATYYEYKIYAINRLGISDATDNWEGETTFNNLPGPPTNVFASFSELMGNEGEKMRPVVLKITWTPPEYVGGSELTGYKIEYKSESGSWTFLGENTDASDTDILHEGRSCGSTYCYRVSAINENGEGESSSPHCAIARPLDDYDCDEITNVNDPKHDDSKEEFKEPGFELIFVIIGIIFIAIWKKKK